MGYERNDEKWLAVVVLLIECCCIAQECVQYQDIQLRTPTIIALTLEPEPTKLPLGVCKNSVQLIVGGERASYGEFPHHALLGWTIDENTFDVEFKCGGTLISNQHVLTAAHCIYYDPPTVVRFGENDILEYSDDEFDVAIVAYRIHPYYSAKRRYNDIGLYTVRFTHDIRPACLWYSDTRIGNQFIATGFGYKDSFILTRSTVMMKVQLEQFSADDCALYFKGSPGLPRGIDDGQLCVGSGAGQGRDTCPGDSGGSLQIVTNPKTCIYSVVGITSAGKACGLGESKALYTKVSYYIVWIEDNVWGANAL
uniref:Peptidase S1 domain-containing protein n=1 Tax=Anopheles farauti TaxID=69004 RepID=A0A182Q6T4_9DIPT